MKKYILIFILTLWSITSAYCMDRFFGKIRVDQPRLDRQYVIENNQDQSNEALISQTEQITEQTRTRRLIQKQRQKEQEDQVNCLLFFYCCGFCCGMV